MEYCDSTDAELLTKIKENDHRAFKEIYKRYWKVCFLQLFKKSSSKELAEELIQNIFISLWERRQIVEINNLSAYLMSAVRFSFINYLKNVLQFDQYAEYKKTHSEIGANSLEEQLAVRELSISIEKGINMLPRKTREVFVLSRLEYNSVKEIAQKLKISEKAVEYHITQSLKAMRLALKDYMIIITFIVSALFCC
ncbi:MULTISPECIES: RNA polymerase sigma factor [Olivibacter]|jgi:RNA polymerase sigma-70 factor (ECF subfamily)|uniref:RNA polymerase sigma factor n=1 Tax=Olivibacter oleidegradans TaxID=760123 RepID=A0ABV6HJJ8_9SPHI|nr:sigma-70 family RNA polymerase sigma factor [Olivibacter jilunii]